MVVVQQDRRAGGESQERRSWEWRADEESWQAWVRGTWVCITLFSLGEMSWGLQVRLPLCLH